MAKDIEYLKDAIRKNLNTATLQAAAAASVSTRSDSNLESEERPRTAFQDRNVRINQMLKRSSPLEPDLPPPEKTDFEWDN